MRVKNLNWKDHPTKQNIYGDIPPISTSCKEESSLCRTLPHHRAKDQVISDLLLWQLPTNRRGQCPFNYMGIDTKIKFISSLLAWYNEIFQCYQHYFNVKWQPCWKTKWRVHNRYLDDVVIFWFLDPENIGIYTQNIKFTSSLLADIMRHFNVINILF